MADTRAAVLQQDRSLLLETVPAPQILPRSALIKVLAVQLTQYTTHVISGTLCLLAWLLSSSSVQNPRKPLPLLGGTCNEKSF